MARRQRARLSRLRHVDGAVQAAREGAHSIPNVMLTEAEVVAHGLGPI